MATQLRQGSGWRVGWDPQAMDFPGLVGSDQWAVELTALEFQDFCRLSQSLAQTMATMAEQVMEEERLSCEAETSLVWVEVEGFPHDYELRFLVLGGRRAEGLWPGRVVPELLEAIVALNFHN